MPGHSKQRTDGAGRSVRHRVLVTTTGLALVASGLTVAAATAASAGLASSAVRTAASGQASTVPDFVQQRVAKVREATGGGHSLPPGQAKKLSDPYLAVTQDGSLDLEIHALDRVGGRERADLNRLGVRILLGSDQWVKRARAKALLRAGVFRALVPYDRVDAVGTLPWVAAVRPTESTPPDVGSFESEGVQLHRADAAQAAGFNGAGVTVGVISDGVSNLAQAQTLGELPSSVNNLGTGSGNEGTAMLEIVHDMAPAAGLAFQATGGGVAAHVAAQNNLAANGADLITEDIPFDSEPAFQKGLAASNAETLAAAGTWVTSSAGNLASSHAPRVLATGTGTTPDGVPSGGNFGACPNVPGNTVAFAGGDTTFDVQVGGGATIGTVLQWSEPRAIFPTAGAGGFTNLDLYLLNAAGTDCLASSTSAQGGGSGDTIEQLSWTNPSATTAANAKLVVDVAGQTGAKATPTIDLRFRGAGAVDTPVRAGSLNPDSNYTDDATSAGAVNAGASTNPATVGVEGFSGGGPVQLRSTTVCSGSYPCPASAPVGQNQSVAGGAGRTAIAPTYASADGVSVSGAGGFGAGSCPATTQGDCRFFGTSAATPSAAGVAALALEAAGGPGTVTPAQLTAILAASAVDRTDSGGAAGPDNVFGAGVLDAYTAAVQVADLSVAKDCLPNGPVAAGASGACTITVRNLGPGTARSVTLTDAVISSGAFSVSTTTTGCTAPAGTQSGSATVTCTLGDLANGATTSVLVTLSGAQPQDIADTATASATTPDPNLVNNSASDSLSIAAAADLALTKSASPANPDAGTTVTWTITVTNNGPSVATGVQITDVTPAQVSAVSVSATGGASCTAGVPGDPLQPATCNVGNLPVGQSRTMTVQATIDPSALGTLNNDARVTATTADPNTVDNEDTTGVTVGARADLVVTNTDTPDPVVPGQPLTYTMTVRNAGPSMARDVSLVEALPAAAGFVSATVTTGSASCALAAPTTNEVRCGVGTLAPGGTTTVLIRTTVASGTLAPLAATATASTSTADPNAANDSATASTAVTPLADLVMALTADKDVYKPSSTIVYTATVTNNGASDARGVSVRIDLPTVKQAIYVFDNGGCTRSGLVLTCPRGTISAGASSSFQVYLTVKGSKGVVVSTATASSSLTTDPNPANNAYTRSVKIGK